MIYNRVDSQNSNSDDMDIISSYLEDWKEAIVHFDGALNWENPKVLLYIFLFVNVIFGIYWCTEPSFLMTLGFIGLFISSADYFGPKILQRYLQGSWTINKEAKYEDFCRRLLNARNHILRGRDFLFELRRERPYSYFVLVTPLLVIFTVLGWRVNNVLLAYLTTLFCLLVPGLRYRGLLQIFTERIKPLFQNKLNPQRAAGGVYAGRTSNGDAKFK